MTAINPFAPPRDDQFFVVPVFGENADVERPIPFWEKLWNKGWLRKCLIIAALAALWQAYGVFSDNSLLFPTFTDTMEAFRDNIVNGVLPARAWTSVRVLLIGYALGIGLATVLSVLAITTMFAAPLLRVSCAPGAAPGGGASKADFNSPRKRAAITRF